MSDHNKNVRILYGTSIDKQIEDFKKQMLNQGYKITVVIEDNGTTTNNTTNIISVQKKS